jgi:hypothetical protein
MTPVFLYMIPTKLTTTAFFYCGFLPKRFETQKVYPRITNGGPRNRRVVAALALRLVYVVLHVQVSV